MKKKRILVDLSILKNVNCGLGQIALNYGNFYKNEFIPSLLFDVYLLVPKKFIGQFGSNVKYIESAWWYKFFPCLLPKMTVWHAIHQRSHFSPFWKSTKYLLTIHDFNFAYEKTGKKRDKYLSDIQKNINRADKITCISHFAKADTERLADTKGKSIDVIYNGVEHLDQDLAQKPSFVQNEKPFFFTIGEVKEKKNFHTLIDLMKLFPEKMLYIAGNKGNNYAQQIVQRIKTEHIENVFLTGIVTNNERIWLYRNCEAFLFPSLFEGFGLPIIEAMSFGKPVFSSTKTSLKEIGGNCAFFWDNFTPEHMQEVINKNLDTFYKNPNLAKQNIDYAMSFSYGRHIKTYWQIYLQLLQF